MNALLAHARGDDDALHSALDAFVRHARGPSTHIDVAFGKAGLLLGCALLGEALGPVGGEAVRLLAIDLADSIWADLQGEPPIAQSTRITLLGAAHGWAGILYALLRGIEAFEREPPEGLAERLEQLAALARPARRGVFWPRDLSAPPTQDGLTASWCNGAAGFVHLWTRAHRVLGEDSYSRLAELAAWTAYEGPEAGGDLCCGLGGRAYALLNLHKQTGEGHWLLRARDLAERAASAVRAAALRRDSLYKGEVGVALLLAELERPADAAMPLFEGEGW